ncbi:SMP-30/gluconolactonase/LRE family protein [Streptomyces sp. NPDC048639]|uniref:SMP-30/gluconolactonase/LRE family protein n=1 Tax=Streptomyces sp. NPDC048639 TaxID=3365581 RepID=UPI0037138149
MGSSSEPGSVERYERESSPPVGGEGRSWRRRLTAMACTAMLCTAGLVSVAPEASAAVPTPGSAPLYISDYTDGTVLKMPADGGPQTTVPTTGLVRPTGMAADPAGNLFISDTGNSQVVKVPADGGPQTVVPTTGLNRPLGLALDAAGDLYIADDFNDRVVKVPADGGPQTTLPTTGLVRPNGLALDATGHLYISDFFNDRVVKIPVGGGPQTTVPTTGLSQPTGLALDPAGNLFISDSAHDRVVRVPAGGGPQTTVPTNGLDAPEGLALDAVGNLFIADFPHDRVVKVPANGDPQTIVPTTGLHTPVGLAIPPYPVPPTGVTATAGIGQATVSFTPSTSPSVTGYTVTATDLTRPSRGGQTAQGTGSPITVTGLTPGDRYRFTVTATNAGQATSFRSARSATVVIPAGHPGARTRLTATPAVEKLHVQPPVLRVEGLSATLTRPNGSPVAGQTIEFTTTAKTRRLCTAVTDSRGVARCHATVRDRALRLNRLYEDLRRHGYLATHTGTPAHRPSSDTAPVWAKRWR